MDIQRGDTGHAIVALMVSASDRVTGVAGLGASVVFRLSKNQSNTFTVATGAVVDAGYGVYKLLQGASDVDTYGPMVVHVEAPGCVPFTTVVNVVSWSAY